MSDEKAEGLALVNERWPIHGHANGITWVQLEGGVEDRLEVVRNINTYDTLNRS